MLCCYRFTTTKGINMNILSGAYASVPADSSWDQQTEQLFYKTLKEDVAISGLEIPFSGQLNRFGNEWFYAQLNSNWRSVITCIPGTMAELSKDPYFGIASDNEVGRSKAIKFYQQANQQIQQFNSYFNKQMVTHVLIHSAPTINEQVPSSVRALVKSLNELQQWDWHGAKLVIEHCDAQVNTQHSEKGFMRIEDEIDAITTVNKHAKQKLGISINWGRSAIEAKSCNGPVEHIKQCIKADLLTGLIFSGASDTSDVYGVWKDSHMPPQFNDFDCINNRDSVLNEEQVKRCMQLQAGTKLDFVGCKISLLPNKQSLATRIKYIQKTLAMIKDCIN